MPDARTKVATAIIAVVTAVALALTGWSILHPLPYVVIVQNRSPGELNHLEVRAGDATMGVSPVGPGLSAVLHVRLSNATDSVTLVDARGRRYDLSGGWAERQLGPTDWGYTVTISGVASGGLLLGAVDSGNAKAGDSSWPLAPTGQR